MMAEPAFPYPDHRSMFDVMIDEFAGCTCELTDANGFCDACPIIKAMEGSAA